MEKIIQASFELPLPARDDLNRALLSQIQAICGLLQDDESVVRFLNIFHDAIAPYIASPRDLARLSNAMMVSWPAVAKEVDVADFTALETMRLFEPSVYNAVRKNKAKVCGLRSDYGQKEDPEKAIEYFLRDVPELRLSTASFALMRLFPRFEKIGYSTSSMERWELQRLVCTSKHFDTYFRMSISDETLSAADIDQFVECCGDREYVKETFLAALQLVRKNGKSKVPLLLDEINLNAHKVEKAKLKPLISALFEIADDLFRREDREGAGGIGDNHLRIHWLIRKLTFERCDLEERSQLFIDACQAAQIGWLVDFTTSAYSNHYPREGRNPTPPEECLVMKEAIPGLVGHTVSRIESAANDGSLIAHTQLAYILFQWEQFAGNDGTVRVWTCAQMKHDDSIGHLARAFTGESWSHGIGMFGLGDRVARRNIRASVDGLERLIDPVEFRRRLEEIEKTDTLNPVIKSTVATFLAAWRRKEQGIDR